MMKRFVPLLLTFSVGATQFVPVRLVLCCRFHPVEGEGQETMTVLVTVEKTLSRGNGVPSTEPT
jgi:hypothetical protein